MVAYKISLYKQILNDPDNIRTYMLAHPTADPATIPAGQQICAEIQPGPVSDYRLHSAEESHENTR